MRMPVLRQIQHPMHRRGLWARLKAMYRQPVVYEVAEEYSVSASLGGRRYVIGLPAGFRSDLASTPRLAWLFGLRPDAPALLLPCLLHDFYYRHGYYATHDGGRLCEGYGQAFADRVLADQVYRMSGLHVPAMVVRLALWLFGWLAWRHNARYRRIGGLTALRGDYTH